MDLQEHQVLMGRAVHLEIVELRVRQDLQEIVELQDRLAHLVLTERQVVRVQVGL